MHSKFIGATKRTLQFFCLLPPPSHAPCLRLPPPRPSIPSSSPIFLSFSVSLSRFPFPVSPSLLSSFSLFARFHATTGVRQRSKAIQGRRTGNASTRKKNVETGIDEITVLFSSRERSLSIDDGGGGAIKLAAMSVCLIYIGNNSKLGADTVYLCIVLLFWSYYDVTLFELMKNSPGK